MTRITVDRGWAWLVMVAACLVHVLIFGTMLTAGVYNVIFLDVFNNTKTATAWATSLTTALTFITGLLGSALTNKFGPRPVIIIGGLISSSGLVLSSFAPNVYYLCATYGILTGGGFGLAYSPSCAALQLSFEKYRGIATGVALSGVGLGTFIFPPLIDLLCSVFGWRGSFLIIGGICLNLVVCGAITRPVARTGLHQDKPRLLELRLFRKYVFVLIVIGNALFSFSLSIVYLHIVAFAMTRGFSQAMSSMLISYMGISNIISRFALGGIGNLPRVNVTVLYCVCLVLTGIVCCLYPVTIGNYALTVCITMLFGIFSAAYGTLIPLVLVEHFGTRDFASSFGIMLIFNGCGQFLGGPFAGFLYDVSKSYIASFIIAGVLLIAGAVLIQLGACIKARTASAAVERVVLEEKKPLPSSLQCADDIHRISSNTE